MRSRSTTSATIAAPAPASRPERDPGEPRRFDPDETAAAAHREALAPGRAHSSEVDALPLERVSDLLPESLIQDDEVVILMLRPSPLYIPLSCVNTLLLLALIMLLLAYLSRWQAWVPWSDTQAFGFGALLCVARLGWQTLEWYSRVYVLTDRRLIRRRGVLRVAVFQTHLTQIQHTSVFARVRERLFGLGTIGFATAGSDTFEAFWVMLRQPFAVHKVVVEAIERYGRKERS